MRRRGAVLRCRCGVVAVCELTATWGVSGEPKGKEVAGRGVVASLPAGGGAGRLSRREVNLALLDALEEPRESDRKARRDEPAIGLALAHPETRRAEDEHRAARGLREEPAPLDLDEVPQDTDEHLAALHAERPETLEERVVREVRELHERFIHPGFAAPDDAPSGPFTPSTASRDLATVKRS